MPTHLTQNASSPQTCGTGTLNLGTLTVSTSAITANSMVFFSVNGAGVLANIGTVYEDKPSRSAGSSFVVKSTNPLSSATFSWLIVEPA